jgi:nucleotide-binding universal stress UspA family protein
MTYKHIMVAVDGSETSHLALQEAIKLAKSQNASLRIVHVIDDSFINYGESYIDYSALLASKKKLGQEVLTKMGDLAHHAHIKYEIQMIETQPFEGRVAEKLVEETQHKPTDLLVIGTHGRRGFNRLFLGSVAENLIRIATLPVLLIRGK